MMRRFAAVVVAFFCWSTLACFAVANGSEVVAGIVLNEDGTPASEATVDGIGVKGRSVSIQTDSSGTFSLTYTPSYGFRPSIVATSKDGNRVGWASNLDHRQRRLVEVTLRQARRIRVRVVDAFGEPVPGAEVNSMIYFSFLDPVSTNDEGFAELVLPSEPHIGCIYAMKNGVGFNYKTNGNPGHLYPQGRFPSEITLALLPSSPATVRVTDSNERPVAGVLVHPFGIELSDSAYRLNLAVFETSNHLSSETNEDGLATFDWIPREFMASLQMLFQADDSASFQFGAQLFPEKRHATTAVESTGEISGTVRRPDGKPASGVKVECRTRGFRAETTTDALGHFGFRPPIKRVVDVYVDDVNWTARPITGIHVAPDEPVDDIHLELERGTTISGRLTFGNGRRPYAEPDDRVILIEKRQGTSIKRTSPVYADGKFRFRVPTGSYELVVPQTSDKYQIAVLNDRDVTRDHHYKKYPYKVVDRRVITADGAPIADAEVAVSIASGHAVTTRTDYDGRFVIRVSNEPSATFVRSVALGLATAIATTDDEPTGIITLTKAKTLTAKVEDANGEPAGNRSVSVRALVDTKNDVRAEMAIDAKTSAAGLLRIEALPRECYGEILVESRLPNETIVFESGSRELQNLGKIVVDRENVE